MRRRPSSSIWIGAVAAAALTTFYAAVVWGASGSLSHLLDQVSADWYLLTPLALGFGLQVGMVAELRRRHLLQASGAAAGGAGAGASTLGMVACCAHHVADLAPFIGAAGAATFLTAYRLPFIFVGLAVTAVGIAISARRLAAVTRAARRESETCAA